MQICSKTSNFTYNLHNQVLLNSRMRIEHSADKVSFRGFQSEHAKSIIALDLDASLLHGTGEEIIRVLKLAQKASATVVYATGRNLEQFRKLEKLERQGIDLPNPQFLVARNGLYVYQNTDGRMVKDKN